MKKIAGLLGLVLFSTQGYTCDTPEPALDKIAFQVSAKQWVSTKTALLTVNINATLNNAELIKARADIMMQLGKIAKGEWHLTQFDRSQDSSGLEKLTVQAQARVDQSSLTDVYKNAKAVSRPGTNYEIGSIEFKPSLEEVQEVKNALREQLYNQVQNELTRINKVYTGQVYSVYDLVFIDGDSLPMPQPKAYQAREMINTMAIAAPAPALTVSNELVMTAIVQVASSRQAEN
ncbi:hypothetical protein [Legionella oakridgensis]|uniref:Periplasmic/secreted protein n=2 Tax=Legionella oakridgensis TaxID=29423 RepID=W0BA20_9GAMM|nr:hypothetical protein [Legionella oakridgensis]AHE67373.1 hypothetical protein Loa_01826 [Legionella oakridgensis ATCC 33761 = DSM 21215]ETO93034.1 hypothetical protein LOR_68c19120 [Legionella oakridgensis RV-2-2007]KTD43442.1 hypothetical protein Loak_0617 [Legionella oakridgensis]STY20433.1 Uncharacterised protein [Legionella longbeachae]